MIRVIYFIIILGYAMGIFYGLWDDGGVFFYCGYDLMVRFNDGVLLFWGDCFFGRFVMLIS
jgi:hypothetical protein